MVGGLDVTGGEQEGDQAAANASVAVDERVDRLELGVQEDGLDQRWQVVVRVDRDLPFV